MVRAALYGLHSLKPILLRTKLLDFGSTKDADERKHKAVASCKIDVLLVCERIHRFQVSFSFAYYYECL